MSVVSYAESRPVKNFEVDQLAIWLISDPDTYDLMYVRLVSREGSRIFLSGVQRHGSECLSKGPEACSAGKMF